MNDDSFDLIKTALLMIAIGAAVAMLFFGGIGLGLNVSISIL